MTDEPTRCKYMRLIREECYWTQDPPEYEECDRDAEPGREFCKRHRDREKGERDE